MRIAELSHRPFAEALATSDDATDDWRRTAAGWVTVRLVDRWLAEGREVVSPHDPGVIALHDALAAVAPWDNEDQERSALTTVIDAMQEAVRPHAGNIRDPLYRYGRVLEERSAWGPAADVFEMVVTQSLGQEPWSQPADAVLADKATIRLALCYRQLGNEDVAMRCFATVRVRAERRGDVARVLWARLGEAKLPVKRGNLALAETLLRHLLNDASTTIDALPVKTGPARGTLIRVRAWIRHDLAAVLWSRGHASEAIQLCYAAWEELPKAPIRGGILNDLGTYLDGVGMRTAAKDAYILARSEGKTPVQWIATVNLLELAVAEHDELSFERCRRDLTGITLPAPLAAALHMYEGRGIARFAAADDSDARSRARTSVAKAIEVAEANGLNKLLIEAEALATTLASPGLNLQPAAHAAPLGVPDLGVATVAAALRRARGKAGA